MFLKNKSNIKTEEIKFVTEDELVDQMYNIIENNGLEYIYDYAKENKSLKSVIYKSLFRYLDNKLR